MKKIFIVYGHYDNKSFNAAIKNTFIETAKKRGHEVKSVSAKLSIANLFLWKTIYKHKERFYIDAIHNFGTSKVDLLLSKYNILPINSNEGYIEIIPNSITLYDLKLKNFSIQNYINEYLNYGFDYTGDDNMSADDKIETYWDEAEGVEE